MKSPVRSHQTVTENFLKAFITMKKVIKNVKLARMASIKKAAEKIKQEKTSRMTPKKKKAAEAKKATKNPIKKAAEVKKEKPDPYDPAAIQGLSTEDTKKHLAQMPKPTEKQRRDFKSKLWSAPTTIKEDSHQRKKTKQTY